MPAQDLPQAGVVRAAAADALGPGNVAQTRLQPGHGGDHPRQLVDRDPPFAAGSSGSASGERQFAVLRRAEASGSAVRRCYARVMTIRNGDELAALQEVGRIVARVLAAMRAAVAPGMTTAALDAVAGEELARWGARSAPRLVYHFPGETCISVNDEVVHGVPGARVLEPGDLVKLDVTAEKDGFMSDAACTVQVEVEGGIGARLAACARAGFERALAAVRPGTAVRELGRMVQAETRRRGFAVIPQLAGHGIGRTIHEEPIVPNFLDRSSMARLEEGMVITIEPLICAGSGRIRTATDGWTVCTADRSLAAHFEHTLVVRRQGPLLLTAA